MLKLEPEIVSLWTQNRGGLEIQRAINVQLSKEVGMGIGRTKATDVYSSGGSKRINEGPLSNKARG